MPQIEITQEEADKLELYAPSYLKGLKKTTAQARQVLEEYFIDREAEESVEDAHKPEEGDS